MMAAKCPDCNSSIEISDDVIQGEILSCPCCGLELEVVKVNGDSIELQELVIEGEDWGE